MILINIWNLSIFFWAFFPFLPPQDAIGFWNVSNPLRGACVRPETLFRRFSGLQAGGGEMEPFQPKLGKMRKT